MTILSVERNWADLPKELLGLIIDRLIDFPDYIRFGAVCKQWLCEAQERRRKWPPLLLIPVGDDDKDHSRLYNIWNQKLYPHRFQVPYHPRCSGSSYGWLAFADKDDSTFDVCITLLNPFSGSTINLPPIMNIPDYDRGFHEAEYFVRRVILSCDPSLHPENWVVAAVHDEPLKVAFIRSGESSWTYLSRPSFFPVSDVCFYREQLYAVNCRNQLIAIDLSDKWRDKDDDDKDVTKFEYLVRPSQTLSEDFTTSYLVEWDEELLLVLRVYLDNAPHLDDDEVIARYELAEVNNDGANNDGETTVGFKLYKLNHNRQHFGDSDDTTAKWWVEINNLGNSCLFLGESETISLCASSFANMQPNCIYYTDGYEEVDEHLPYEADDMGIFDLATGKISQHYTLEPSQRYMPPALWIMPKTS